MLTVLLLYIYIDLHIYGLMVVHNCPKFKLNDLYI